MPQFVRADLRLDRWLETVGRQPQDFPPDVITDLKTKGDLLSVFEVTDAVTAERIAVAVGAGKGRPDDITYAVFERAAIEALGIPINKNEGGTIDAVVNTVHHDLHVATATKLVELAGVIASGQVVSILKKDAIVLLRRGFESGQLDHTKRPDLSKRVNAVIPTHHEPPPVVEE